MRELKTYKNILLFMALLTMAAACSPRQNEWGKKGEKTFTDRGGELSPSLQTKAVNTELMDAYNSGNAIVDSNGHCVGISDGSSPFITEKAVNECFEAIEVLAGATETSTDGLNINESVVDTSSFSFVRNSAGEGILSIAKKENLDVISSYNLSQSIEVKTGAEASLLVTLPQEFDTLIDTEESVLVLVTQKSVDQKGWKMMELRRVLSPYPLGWKNILASDPGEIINTTTESLGKLEALLLQRSNPISIMRTILNPLPQAPPAGEVIDSTDDSKTSFADYLSDRSTEKQMIVHGTALTLQLIRPTKEWMTGRVLTKISVNSGEDQFTLNWMTDFPFYLNGSPVSSLVTLEGKPSLLEEASITEQLISTEFGQLISVDAIRIEADQAKDTLSMDILIKKEDAPENADSWSIN